MSCDEPGGVIGVVAIGAAAIGAGAPRSACNERHVEKMLPTAFSVDSCGGLAGGEANSADCRRVSGGRAGSHEMADGSSIFELQND